LERTASQIGARGLFPDLLPAKRRDIEVVPSAHDLLVTPIIYEVASEDVATIAIEHVRAVPIVDVSFELYAQSFSRERSRACLYYPLYAFSVPGEQALGGIQARLACRTSETGCEARNTTPLRL
jgi:hypothetical protein